MAQKKSKLFIFTTKMVFPKSLKFVNSGSELFNLLSRDQIPFSLPGFLEFSLLGWMGGFPFFSTIIPFNKQPFSLGFLGFSRKKA